MAGRHSFLFIVLLTLVTSFAGRAALAQQTKSDDDVKNEKLQAVVEESVQWYELLPAADSLAAMRPQVVLRWRNASRGQQGQDLLILWTHEGRPQAGATIFPGGRTCATNSCPFRGAGG